jgi:catechol 2,3-dioxygenase-like lactoylglutathione lyase family enzyme
MTALRHLGYVFLTGLVTFSAVRSEASVSVSHVGCPGISVASLQRSVAFYTGVLDFHVEGIEDSSTIARLEPGTPATTRAQTAHLVLGDECLDLNEYKSPRGRAYPTDSRGNDRWFQHIAIVVSNMDQAFSRVRTAGVRFVSNEPQTLPAWNKDAGGIKAFYFRDPDGHYLELIYFPPGKGQAKWQRRSGKLFLGIDHTAIVVSDIRRSIDFYRGQLHFNVTGRSDNYGPEQEHLSGVSHAHVLIASLRVDSGMGIELLDYLTPASGRSIPADSRPDDIASWQTPLELASESSPLEEDDAHWVKLPAGHAAWIKDPDGHLLELVTQ